MAVTKSTITNEAAFQPHKKAPKFNVSTGPSAKIGKDQVLVRNKAVAVNPIDWLIQSRGDVVFNHIKYPFVLGYDTGAEVVEVGENVTYLSMGDRIAGLAIGSSSKINDPAQGTFQNYTVLNPSLTSKLPDSMSFENGAVLPLGLITAATALFDQSQLALDQPTVPARPSNGKTVIIWGGSTSVGCMAIQLAVAAGYEVFTTASPRNFHLVTKLGAAKVWDYKSPTVVDDIAAAMKGKTLVGSLSIGDGAAEMLLSILGKCNGNKFIALVTVPLPPQPKSLSMVRTMGGVVVWLGGFKARGMLAGIKSAIVDVSVTYTNGLAKYIFNDFTPKALESGVLVPAPEPKVIGHGLDKLQEAMDIQRNGVSAVKIVVTL